MPPLETDPLDWAVDPLTGDLATGADGGPYFVSGLAGVAQLARQAVLLFRGEWFLDLDAGVPWLPSATVGEDEAILGSKAGAEAARAAVRAALLGVPGVVAVTSLALDLDARTRTLSVTYVVKTAFGDTPPDLVTISAGAA